MLAQRPCWLLLLLLLVALSSAAALDWQWRTGRATNYGGQGDPWSIHHGSCGYKWLDPTTHKGWDVAALADSVGDYKGSCGRCYEIGCAPMHLKDGYGTDLDRSHVCYDTSQTLTVMITDTCPCNYPANAYSNKRWCCNDMYHFDMSAWAFSRLADKKFGVIGIRYREVPCDHCPDKPALLPSGQWPERPSEGPPGGWQPSWDKRPWGAMCFESSERRQDSQDSGGSRDSKDSGGSRDSKDSGGSRDSNQRKDGGGGGGGSGGRQLPAVFPPADSLLSGWQDLFGGSTWTAPDGRAAFCGTLDGSASLVFKSPSGGALVGRRELAVDVKTLNGQVPDFTLTLSSSSKGACRSIDLRSLSASVNGDWARLTLPLINTNWFSAWTSQAREFIGCSGSITAWDVDKLEFKNRWGGQQSLCLANVKAS